MIAVSNRVLIDPGEYLDLRLHLFNAFPLERQLLLLLAPLLLQLLEPLFEASGLRGGRLPLVLRRVQLALQHTHALLQVLVVQSLLLQQVHLVLQIHNPLLVDLSVLLELGHLQDFLLVYFNDGGSVL